MKSFFPEEEEDWVEAAPAAGEHPAAEEEAARGRNRRGRTRGGKGQAPEPCRSWRREGPRGPPEAASPPPGTTTAGVRVVAGRGLGGAGPVPMGFVVPNFLKARATPMLCMIGVMSEILVFINLMKLGVYRHLII